MLLILLILESILESTLALESILAFDITLSILFSKALTSDVAIACELIFDPITELSIKSESALTSAAETIGMVNKRHMNNPMIINVLLFIYIYLLNKNLINKICSTK